MRTLIGSSVHTAVNQERLSRLKWLLAVVQEHRSEQREWFASPHPEVAAISGHKRIPALRSVLQTLGYDDVAALEMWIGVSTGNYIQPHEVLKTREEWARQAKPVDASASI